MRVSWYWFSAFCNQWITITLNEIFIEFVVVFFVGFLYSVTIIDFLNTLAINLLLIRCTASLSAYSAFLVDIYLDIIDLCILSTLNASIVIIIVSAVRSNCHVNIIQTPTKLEKCLNFESFCMTNLRLLHKMALDWLKKKFNDPLFLKINDVLYI